MKKRMVRIVTLLLLMLTIQWTQPTTLMAQCPMCKMSAESNLKNGGTDGKGLNNGILYMLATPYILVFGIGVFWYYNRRKESEVEGSEAAELN